MVVWRLSIGIVLLTIGSLNYSMNRRGYEERQGAKMGSRKEGKLIDLTGQLKDNIIDGKAENIEKIIREGGLLLGNDAVNKCIAAVLNDLASFVPFVTNKSFYNTILTLEYWGGNFDKVSILTGYRSHIAYLCTRGGHEESLKALMLCSKTIKWKDLYWTNETTAESHKFIRLADRKKMVSRCGELMINKIQESKSQKSGMMTNDSSWRTSTRETDKRKNNEREIEGDSQGCSHLRVSKIRKEESLKGEFFDCIRSGGVEKLECMVEEEKELFTKEVINECIGNVLKQNTSFFFFATHAKFGEIMCKLEEWGGNFDYVGSKNHKDHIVCRVLEKGAKNALAALIIHSKTIDWQKLSQERVINELLARDVPRGTENREDILACKEALRTYLNNANSI